jgi:hypothetical protein
MALLTKFNKSRGHWGFNRREGDGKEMRELERED